MTDLLKQAFDQVRNLPIAEQDRIALSLLELVAADHPPEKIPSEHYDDVIVGLGQLNRGEFVSEEAVESMLAKILE